MSKKNKETTAKVPGIEAGKPITVQADSRPACNAKIAELREQANAAGLKNAEGGFIQHKEGLFFAVITFKS